MVCFQRMRRNHKIWSLISTLEQNPEEVWHKLSHEILQQMCPGRGRTDEDLHNLLESMTYEEVDYYKRKKLEVPPERRYHHKKEHWYFHETSWYMRGVNGYDGYGCNNGVCVPECRYYPKEGRIEDEEVESWYGKRTTTTHD
jgi:hypothetical protein